VDLHFVCHVRSWDECIERCCGRHCCGVQSHMSRDYVQPHRHSESTESIIINHRVYCLFFSLFNAISSPLLCYSATNGPIFLQCIRKYKLRSSRALFQGGNSAIVWRNWIESWSTSIMIAHLRIGTPQMQKFQARGWTIRSSNPGRGKRFFSPPKRPERLSAISTLCSVVCGFLPRR
jgi:hypothetical protein